MGTLARQFHEQLVAHPKEKLPPVARFQTILPPRLLPNLVRQALRTYLSAHGLRGRLDIASWNGPVIDRRGRPYFVVCTLQPSLRTYHVFENGKVADKGCDYEGRGEGRD